MASIRRHPNALTHWQVRYRDTSGRQRTKNFSKRSDAEKFAATTEADKVRGDWSDPRLAKTTFGEWCTRWEAARLGRRASTRARDMSVLQNHILPVFAERQLGGIQPADLRQFVSDLTSAGYAAASVRKAYQLLAGALDSAVDDGLIPRSPARNIALPKIEHVEVRFLSADQISVVANAIDPQFRALVLTAGYTGLRAGELSALKLDRLQLLRRSLTVAETLSDVQGRLTFGPPKSNASRRTVSLPAALCDELGRHLRQFPTDSLVFQAPDGGPLRWTNFRRRHWQPAVAAALGFPVRFHDLRHSHAALLIAAGEHPKVIQQRLGHASIRTTLDTYGHLFDGLDEAAADRLDEVFRASHVDRLWTESIPQVVSLPHTP